MPLLLRLFFGAAGLFTIITPVWEFRQAFLHPNWLSLFFGAMVLGAWSVGGAFVAAAIFGEEQRWRVEDGKITIYRCSALRRWTTIALKADICETTIKETTWDSGPNTFSVVLRLKSGDEFETQGHEKRTNAEALEARLRQRMQLD